MINGVEMAKKTISQDQFIEKCNEELKKHSLYEEDYEILPAPEGSTGSTMSGTSWKGPYDKRAIWSTVVQKVREEYEVKVTPR